MVVVEDYQRMCLDQVEEDYGLCFKRDSFVENVRTIILSQPIPTTWDVSNVRIIIMDGLNS